MVPLLSNGGTFRTVCERATVSIKGSSSSPSDFSVARLLFRHQKSSGSKLLLRLVLANLRNRADRFAGGFGLASTRTCTPTYAKQLQLHELTYECCFLNKEVNKFLATCQGMWQKYKDYSSRLCESRRKKNIMGRNITEEKRKGRKNTTND